MLTKKQKGILAVTVIALILVFAGVTYAFFTADIGGTETASTIIVTGGRLEIVYQNNSNVITMENIYPRESAWVTKTFTVTGTNTTDLTMNYKVGLQVDAYEFESGDLTYTLTSTAESGTSVNVTNNTSIPSSGVTYFGEGSFIKGKNKTHNYTLNIYYLDNGQNQNYNSRHTTTTPAEWNISADTKNKVKASTLNETKEETKQEMVVQKNEPENENNQNISFKGRVVIEEAGTGEIETGFTGTIYTTASSSIGNSIVPVTGTKYVITNGVMDAPVGPYESPSECETALVGFGSPAGFSCQQKTGTFGGINNYTTNENEITSTFYLMHEVENNIIKESYVKFVVTPEIAAANEGMVAKTYTLRGAGGTNCTTNNGQITCETYSPYYSDNVDVLKEAFDYDNHSSRCTINTSAGSSDAICSVDGLNAVARADGGVSADDDSAECDVDKGGSSYCDV